jgi:serine/threonine-protein kinase HipA
LGSPLDENRPSFKNFSILETELIDYRLSPAYDLLNSRIHVKDTDFALDQGLLPSSIRSGQIATQFAKLADLAGISPPIFDQVMARMVSGNEQVQQLVSASFLSQSTQRNYLQLYQSRLKRLCKALND